MAIHEIDHNNIPLKAYMRADSYSQQFILKNNDIKKDLVTKEMFWGSDGNKSNRLYLDYTDVSERQILVRKGISKNDSMRELNKEQCDEWIEDNLLKIKNDNIIVVQGYAGTGKSTLLNYIINNISFAKTFYVDICEKWNYEKEKYLFFSKSLKLFRNYLDCIFSQKTRIRNKVWKRFIDLMSLEYSDEFDSDLQNLSTVFNELKKTNKWKNLSIKICTYLEATFSERNEKSSRPNNVNWYSRGQTQLIVSLTILAFSAMYIEKCIKENKLLIVFDNLDIITNPAIPSENVVSLWGVINNYQKFKSKHYQNSNVELPNIGIQISVRKVLYSHITSHLPDLEMNLCYNKDYIQVCDMSNLYSSQDILNHRISYWLKNSNLTDSMKEKFEYLSQISNIHSKDNVIYSNNSEIDDLNIYINLDALFNHNYRAFINAFSELLEKKDYSDYITKDLSKNSPVDNWQKVSTLIYYLSLLYRDLGIWDSLGFGCNYFETSDFPTTLNRLVLNCLYYSRVGYYLKTKKSIKTNLPSNEYITLDCLVNKFSKNKFIKVKTENDFDTNQRDYSNSINSTHFLIVDRLAEMCARNPTGTNSASLGYNSEDDELWRRPLFFIGGIKLNHTAISKEDIADAFKNALLNNSGENISFLITDEGLVLIRDIVANFEFYSARYSENQLSKPLHHVQSDEEVDNLITPVYNAIIKCIEKHKLFMNDYLNNYNINVNNYLNEWFHARTNPKFETNGYNVSILKETSFRPQLHIVRVIYSHIFYFNYVKTYVFNSSLENKTKICEKLTEWIEKYLKLYKNNFYEWIEETEFNADNNVYDRLQPLAEKQKKNPYININISLRTNRRRFY